MKTRNERWKLIRLVPLVAIAILSIGNRTGAVPDQNRDVREAANEVGIVVEGGITHGKTSRFSACHSAGAGCALLSPGGVAFARDSGKHWIAIQGPWSYGRSFSSGPADLGSVFPFVLPYSGFYDDTEDPIRHTSSLYVALRGRGIVRVDAPFAKLGVEP